MFGCKELEKVISGNTMRKLQVEARKEGEPMKDSLMNGSLPWAAGAQVHWKLLRKCVEHTSELPTDGRGSWLISPTTMSLTG